MLDGDLIETAFTNTQMVALERTLYAARMSTGLDFTVYVGRLASGRDSAIMVHRQLAGAERCVLAAVDPDNRAIEIVTGAVARETLDDQSCRLATLSMISRFSIGDIAAGIRDGIQVLAEHGRAFRTMDVLHINEPE